MKCLFVVTCALVSAALSQEEAMEAAMEAAAPLAGAGLGAVHTTNVAVPGQFSYVVSSLHPLNPVTEIGGEEAAVPQAITPLSAPTPGYPSYLGYNGYNGYPGLGYHGYPGYAGLGHLGYYGQHGLNRIGGY